MPVNTEASRFYAYHVEFCPEDPAHCINPVLLGRASMELLDSYNADFRFNSTRPVDPLRLPDVDTRNVKEKITAERSFDGWLFDIEFAENRTLKFLDDYPNSMMSKLQFMVPKCGVVATDMVCKRLLLEGHNAPRIPLPARPKRGFLSIPKQIDKRRFIGGNYSAQLALTLIRQTLDRNHAQKSGTKVVKDLIG
ncbi:MAG TPA: hypothetical protein VF733_06590 [Candidatus Saccharimonadales bacterium]